MGKPCGSGNIYVLLGLLRLLVHGSFDLPVKGPKDLFDTHWCIKSREKSKKSVLFLLLREYAQDP
jgi:hypothetical protein